MATLLWLIFDSLAATHSSDILYHRPTNRDHLRYLPIFRQLKYVEYFTASSVDLMVAKYFGVVFLWMWNWIWLKISSLRLFSFNFLGSSPIIFFYAKIRLLKVLSYFQLACVRHPLQMPPLLPNISLLCFTQLKKKIYVDSIFFILDK